MAITIGVGPTDATDNTSGGSAQVTLVGTTAGRSLAICVRWLHATATIAGVAVSGESDAVARTQADGGSQNVQWFTVDSLASGGSKTITVIFSGFPPHVGVMAVELAGGNTADIFDSVANATGSSADPTVNITTGSNNNAVLAACFTSNTNELVEGAGYTAIALGQTSGTAHGEYDLDAGAAGVVAAGFTDSSGTGTWALSAIALNIDNSSSGAASGTGTATGVGAATAASVGAASATSTVIGVSGGTQAADGAASGTGTASGVGVGLAIAVGAAAGTGTASAVADPIIPFAGVAAFDLPVATLSATQVAGPHSFAAFRLVPPTLTAQMIAGETMSAAFSLPVVTLQASMNEGARFNLPVITLSATMLPGELFSSTPRLPVLSLSAQMSSDNRLGALPVLPVLRLAATMLVGTDASASFSLPVVRLAATLAPGQLMTATPVLPVLTLSSSMLQQVVMTAAFRLPVLRLAARLDAAAVENYRTWVLNTRRSALTQYVAWEFNSFALFNGQVLAVGPDGLMILGTEGLDDEAEIVSVVRFATSDYGESALKRVPRIYAGLKAEGDILFRTITSETGERTYRLPYNHVIGYNTRRVPVGKGPKARYWSFEIENEGGADFSIQSILTYPTLLRRRAQ